MHMQCIWMQLLQLMREHDATYRRITPFCMHTRMHACMHACMHVHACMHAGMRAIDIDAGKIRTQQFVDFFV